MELVLFELPDGPTNMPDVKMQESLHQISQNTGLVYTIHLPKDLTMRDGATAIMLAEKVLARTQNLPVHGVVVHIEGWYWREHQTAEENPADYTRWLNEGRKLLLWLRSQVQPGWQVFVENIEGTPADEVTKLMEGLDVTRCIDVGHLLKDHHPDPLGYVQQNLGDCCAIHLHATDTDGSDHHSVALLDEDFLDRLITILIEAGFDGVLTLEVFGQADFQSSVQAIESSLSRIGASWEN
jgi:sugar phosphate isomerase/epimerase